MTRTRTSARMGPWTSPSSWSRSPSACWRASSSPVRLGVPAPLLLVVVGACASFLPFVPQVHLEPEVVLLGLLPPLLYSAAVTSSLVDFNAHRRAILTAVGRRGAGHDAGRRLGRAHDGPGRLVGDRLRARRGRGAARRGGRDRDRSHTSACRAGSSRSSRASRSSTTPRRWSPCGRRSRRRPAASRSGEVGVDFLVASVGGVLARHRGVHDRGPDAPPHQGPGARRRVCRS